MIHRNIFKGKQLHVYNFFFLNLHFAITETQFAIRLAVCRQEDKTKQKPFEIQDRDYRKKRLIVLAKSCRVELTHCRLNELSHTLYRKILISILGDYAI